MICHLCEKDKLSNEFPFHPLTESCDHAVLHCLRCATASVQRNNKCSQCENDVKEDNERYKEYMETLEFLFPNLEVEESAKQDISSVVASISGISFQNIAVETVSGDSATFAYSSRKTILELKQEIEKKFMVSSNKQRLLYSNKELKVTDDNNDFLTLEDYRIPSNSTLHLMILLYEVPEGLDEVIFDLCWGFPYNQYGRRKRFLDTSVFLFSGSEYIDVVDFKSSTSPHCGRAVQHSGRAEMDYDTRIGHNRVTASLRSIPDYIDRLVFTLSAYNSPNLSKYPRPSLKFFDAKYPDKLLCSDEMNQAASSQAIVMCSLTRKDGVWIAISVKGRAPGCAKNYNPLITKIESLIRRGFI